MQPVKKAVLLSGSSRSLHDVRSFRPEAAEVSSCHYKIIRGLRGAFFQKDKLDGRPIFQVRSRENYAICHRD
jgi:hypothetical protein